jgi:hypothetical protein
VVASLRGCGRSPAMTFPSFRGPIPLERHLGDLGNLYLPFCTEIYGYLHSHSMILRPRETGRAPHTYCGSRLRAATAKRLQVDGLNHHAKTRIYALCREASAVVNGFSGVYTGPGSIGQKRVAAGSTLIVPSQTGALPLPCSSA